MPNTLPLKAESQSKPSANKPKGTQGRPKSKRVPELDIALGARIRAARVSAGMSQTALGAVVGVTFQQVQKYEKGADRVAASTLQGFATALGVHPGSFYDGDPMLDASIAEIKAARRIAKIAQRIQNPTLLKRIVALMEHFASTGDIVEERTEHRSPLYRIDEGSD